MTCINVSVVLPNPTRLADPTWQLFNAYVAENGIVCSDHPALCAYQGQPEGDFLGASDLNHCLNLDHYGWESEYARSARDGFHDELIHGPSREAIDSLFGEQSYAFPNGSVVYKGIGTQAFYEYMNLACRGGGDVLVFPGYFSTTVCREKAESFAAEQADGRRVLLKVTGLSGLCGLVPVNRCVPYAYDINVPEQEILFPRGCSFRVSNRDQDGCMVVLTIEPTG